MHLVHGSATRRSPDIKRVVKTNAGRPPNVTGVVKLSVIVPFYNVQQYAPDTLKSLGANAREDFEFILVDDCSTRRDTGHSRARGARAAGGGVSSDTSRTEDWRPRATRASTRPAAST